MFKIFRELGENSGWADCYDELIHTFVSVTYKSSVAYITATMIFVWFLHPFIPPFILIPWAVAQFLYPITRLYLAKKYKNIPLSESIKVRFQYIHLLMGLIGGVIWGLGSVLCAIYAPSPYEYMVLALIIGLSAGSLSTLSPLYRVYLAYNLPSLILLLISFLIYGDSLHYAFAFMIGIFLIIVPSATYDIHKNFKRSVELNSLYAKAQDELTEINTSLEERVSKAVEDNRQKDKQMLAQSRLAQMGEMISMIAHQWRQPLSAISSTTGSMTLHMELEEYDNKFMQEHIEKINTYTQYLSTTITDFRNFFKSDKEKSLTSLNEIVKGALSIIGTSLESEGIIIETFFGSKEEIYSYPNELKQVVLNIIKNAQDVFNEKTQDKDPPDTRAKYRIFIKTETSPTELKLMIKDNAGGISETDKLYIFDPYFTTKEQRDGTGLGLYMSKMIVEDHCKGRLSVENEDEGACFTIALPRT